jgi:foldase protein PrsA
MENDQISGPIDTGEGYYFLKCLDKYNQELTDAHRISMEEERRKIAFDQVYLDFAGNLSWELNQKAWETVKIDEKEAISTRNFFITYEQFCLK